MAHKSVCFNKPMFDEGKHREDEGEVPYRDKNRKTPKPKRDLSLSVSDVKQKVTAKKNGYLIKSIPWLYDQQQLLFKYENCRSARIQAIEADMVWENKRHKESMNTRKFHIGVLQGKNQAEMRKKKLFTDDEFQKEKYILGHMWTFIRDYLAKEAEGKATSSTETAAEAQVMDEDHDFGEDDPFA